MVGIPQGGFTESGQLAVWLKSQSEANTLQFSAAMASRVALRALPYAVRRIYSKPDIQESAYALLRANLIADVAVKHPTRELKNASRAARAPSFSSAGSASLLAGLNGHVLAAGLLDGTVSSAFKEFSHESTTVTDSATVWNAIDADVMALANGVSPSQLAGSSLWPVEAPNWWRNELTRFQAALVSSEHDNRRTQDRNWLVWFHWFNARAAGRPAFDLPDAIAENLEMRIALGDNGRTGFWDREPHEVNAEITKWVEAERAVLRQTIHMGETDLSVTPDIPNQALAPLETEITNNQVVLRRSAVSQNPTGTASIHKILLVEASYLAERLRGQMPDAAHLMDACKENLAMDIDDINVYGVDYFWLALNQIVNKADEQLLEDAAGRFSGFILNLERFLKQFPEWVNYHRQADLNAFKVDPKLENVGTAKEITKIIAAQPNTVSSEVVTYLGKLAMAVADGQVYNPETAYGFMRSLANVIQSIGTIALGSEWTKGYKKQLHDISTKWAATSTLVVGGELARVLLGGIATELMGFSVAYPYMFGWVGPLLRYLGVLG